jgi:hypothetical protein
MRKQLTKLMIVLTLCTFVFASCKKDDSVVEKNGLTKAINDVISQDILDVLDSLGMPINKGGNPPTIEGTYLSSPHTLYASNRAGDSRGDVFSDLQLTFSNQNQKKLTVQTGYAQANLVFDGMGSFIVGDKKEFSVFVFDKEYNHDTDDSCLIARIFSGELTADGIANMYTAVSMLDDYGDPNDIYIEVGDTRVLYDADGLSDNVEVSTVEVSKSIILKKGNTDSGK